MLLMSATFCCSSALTECVVVPHPPKDRFLASSNSPVLHLRHKELPDAPAFVIVSTYEPSREPSLLLSTDSYGTVAVPELASGKYRVSAFDGEGNGANILIEVMQQKARKPSSFELSMQPAYSATHMRAESIGAVPQLDGSIVDPAGAVIPNARIAVVAADSRSQLLQLSSDLSGRFAARVPDGSYVAYITYPGFASRMIRFEVLASATGTLTVRLNIGMSC